MSSVIHFPLGPIDHCPPPSHQSSVIYFGIKSGVSYGEVFDFLQEGLHRLFLRAPWLNGMVHAQSSDTPGWRPGQLEIRYPSKVDATRTPKCPQLHYKELETAVSFEDIKLRGFPIDVFEDEELTWVSYNPKGADFEAGVDVIAAQANFMPGACLLSPSVHHATCDAIGMGIVMKLWGDECCALSLEKKQGRDGRLPRLPEQIWDRMLPERLWQKAYPAGRSVADVGAASWRMLGLDPPAAGMDAKQSLVPTARTRLPREPQIMTSRVFYISSRAFQALRETCQRLPASEDVSGNDAVLALMWRTVMRARVAARKQANPVAVAISLDETAELQIVNDARAAFSAALPPLYLGNCIFHHRPTVLLRSLLDDHDGLATVASAIRASARTFTQDAVLDAYLLMKQMPDWTRLHPLRHMSVPDTWVMSSMIAMDDRSTSFGDLVLARNGQPYSFRMLMGNRNRAQVHACYVMPQQKHGGMELVLSMFADEWPHVMADTEFGRYAELVV